jgi:hypothetical protein
VPETVWDVGFTALEQTIMDSGDSDRVVAMREDFQRVMADRYKHVIEELTDRSVLAFLSQAHVEPDITMEIFFVDRPLDGFGAVEVIRPPLRPRPNRDSRADRERYPRPKRSPPALLVWVTARGCNGLRPSLVLLPSDASRHLRSGADSPVRPVKHSTVV